MIFTLTCPNGSIINMSHFILQQMEGKLTRAEVQERIDYYKANNV
jgi:hypothetical protein